MSSRQVLIVAVVTVLSSTAYADTIYVDDDGPNDPGPNNSGVSDPAEDGSADHPFDSIQEALNQAALRAGSTGSHEGHFVDLQ